MTVSNIDKMKYKEEHDPEHVYIFSGPCVFCGQERTVTVKGPELFHYRKTGRIQSLISNSLDDREFLISGICSVCWDDMAADNNEE